MRVVLAARDPEAVDWLAGVLGSAGFSVAIVPDPTPTSPELKGAELLIADSECAAALGEAGPRLRLLLASRSGTVDRAFLDGGFVDVLPVPSPPEEIIARVQHALRS